MAYISTRISTFWNIAAKTRTNLCIYPYRGGRTGSLPTGCNPLLLNKLIGVRSTTVSRAHSPSIERFLLSLKGG